MDPDAGHAQLLWHASNGEHGGYMDGMPGAVELAMEAGDALLLCESTTHGSTVRTLPGHRRMCLLRYGPANTIATAHAPEGWQAPPEVFARLSAEAKAVISPHPAEPEPDVRDEPAAKL
jgi:hypothetical protein